MSDNFDYNQYGPNRQMAGFAVKWILAIGALVMFIVIMGGLITFAAGWVSLPFRKGSAENVEIEWTTGVNTYESLIEGATKVCIAQKAYNEAPDGTVKTQRQTQLIATELVYANVVQNYNSWAENAFRGGYIRRLDLDYELPERAPSLDDMLQSQYVNCTAER